MLELFLAFITTNFKPLFIAYTLRILLNPEVGVKTKGACYLLIFSLTIITTYKALYLKNNLFYIFYIFIYLIKY